MPKTKNGFSPNAHTQQWSALPSIATSRNRRCGDHGTASYEHFVDRLRKALDWTGLEQELGRNGALADHNAVSRETARKWLTGLALPELSRIIELARDSDVSPEWLATGRGAIPLGVGETSAI